LSAELSVQKVLTS